MGCAPPFEPRSDAHTCPVTPLTFHLPCHTPHPPSSLLPLLQIRLLDAEWATRLIDGSDASLRDQLAQGCTSAQSGALGWNAIVRPALGAANLFVVDRQRAIISIPQMARYSVGSPETVSVLLPAAALKCCGDDVPATPSLIVQVTPPPHPSRSPSPPPHPIPFYLLFGG